LTGWCLPIGAFRVRDIPLRVHRELRSEAAARDLRRLAREGCPEYVLNVLLLVLDAPKKGRPEGERGDFKRSEFKSSLNVPEASVSGGAAAAAGAASPAATAATASMQTSARTAKRVRLPPFCDSRSWSCPDLPLWFRVAVACGLHARLHCARAARARRSIVGFISHNDRFGTLQ
jgi:hypothetical protein